MAATDHRKTIARQLSAANELIYRGLPKSMERIRRIRKKYRALKWTSHGGGAGGARNTVEFRAYSKVVQLCDYLERKQHGSSRS